MAKRFTGLAYRIERMFVGEKGSVPICLSLQADAWRAFFLAVSSLAD